MQKGLAVATEGLAASAEGLAVATEGLAASAEGLAGVDGRRFAVARRPSCRDEPSAEVTDRPSGRDLRLAVADERPSCRDLRLAVADERLATRDEGLAAAIDRSAAADGRPSCRDPRRGATVPGVYTRDELLGLTGVSARTLGVYTKLGFLPRPVLAGPNTRYSEEHLVRLLAVTKLRNEEHLPLAAIGARLAAMTHDEMDEYVSEAGPAAEDADGASCVETPPAAGAPARAGTAATAWGGAEGRRGTRYTLAPGVELLVDDDAPPASRALVDTLLAASPRR